VRVVYFGTPDFAVPSLRALVGEGFEVVGVVTRPDKPTGRHRSHATPSAVKVAALADDLPVLQPERPSEPDFLAQIEALATQLKKRCGSGGTVRDGVIEIQGEHRDAVVAQLARRGFAAKRSGG
jgi:methionyl-tRNA formyltransferase